MEMESFIQFSQSDDETTKKLEQPWLVKPKPKSLHEEILLFYEYHRPTETEHRARTEVVLSLESILKAKWPAIKIHTFGSFSSGLYIFHSDIDIFVQTESSNISLNSIAKTLRSKGFTSEYLVIKSAKVPIVKVLHSNTGILLDISLDCDISRLPHKFVVKSLKEYKHVLRPLIVFLKYFLYQRSLNNPATGGMGSYTLLLMLVRFLQYKQKVIGKSAFSDLGILLVQFFYFYSEQFNYVELGISVKKDCFIKKPDPNKLLWVQDPMNPDNNVARPVYMGKIMEAFKYAYSTLLSPQNQRIGLSRLIVTDKIHDKRKKFWTKHKTPDERFNTKYIFEDERSSPERQKRKRTSNTEDQESNPKRRKIQETEDQESTPKRRKIQKTSPSTPPEEDSEVIEISDEEATELVPDDPNIDVHMTKDLNLDRHVSTDAVDKDEKKPRKKRARPKKKSGKKDSNHVNGSFPKRRKLEQNDSTNHKKFNSQNGKTRNKSKRGTDGQNRANSNRKNRSNSDLKNRSEYNKKNQSQNKKKNQNSSNQNNQSNSDQNKQKKSGKNRQMKSDQNRQMKSDKNRQMKSDKNRQMKSDQNRQKKSDQSKQKKKFQKSIPASKQPVKPKSQKPDVIVLS